MLNLAVAVIIPDTQRQISCPFNFEGSKIKVYER